MIKNLFGLLGFSIQKLIKKDFLDRGRKMNDSNKISKEDLRKYGREVKTRERLSLMFMVLIFWFLCTIGVVGIRPKFVNLVNRTGQLKYEFPENVKEILKSKRMYGQRTDIVKGRAI